MHYRLYHPNTVIPAISKSTFIDLTQLSNLKIIIMPSLREYQALWNTTSDVFHCQVAEKEHPELHALLGRTLEILETWHVDMIQADMSDSDTDTEHEEPAR